MMKQLILILLNFDDDAKWEDGTTVTAEDFFFAWRMGIDTSAPYSFLIADYIEGAGDYAAYDKASFLAEKDAAFANLSDEEKSARIEAMTEAELEEYKTIKDELWANVKVVAEDSTIKITVAVPAPYFPNLTAFAVYAPVKEDFIMSKQLLINMVLRLKAYLLMDLGK